LFRFFPFRQAVFDACAIARAELHDVKVRKSGKVKSSARDVV
jgi:hypothetical protein